MIQTKADDRLGGGGGIGVNWVVGRGWGLLMLLGGEGGRVGGGKEVQTAGVVGRLSLIHI